MRDFECGFGVPVYYRIEARIQKMFFRKYRMGSFSLLAFLLWLATLGKFTRCSRAAVFDDDGHLREVL